MAEWLIAELRKQGMKMRRIWLCRKRKKIMLEIIDYQRWRNDLLNEEEDSQWSQYDLLLFAAIQIFDLEQKLRHHETSCEKCLGVPRPY